MDRRQRQGDHRGGAAVRRRDGRVRLLRAGLHQGGRSRHRRGGAGGRDDRQGIPVPGHARAARADGPGGRRGGWRGRRGSGSADGTLAGRAPAGRRRRLAVRTGCPRPAAAPRAAASGPIAGR